jgi:cell division protein FtsN
MVARVVLVVCGVVAGALTLGACSFTKADDAPVPSRITNAVVPTAGAAVVGTLPPISTAPPTTVVTSPPTEVPPSTELPVTRPPATRPPATAPATAAPAAPTHSNGPVSVQAGAFSTREAATLGVAQLAGKGFGGFAVAGDGPFRVVRGGLSGADADALVQALAAAGVSAFVRG